MRDFLKRNQTKITITSLAFILILVWSTVLKLPDEKLHIKVLDVWQGDSVFIRTPGGYKVLIDGGPDDRVLDHLGRELPFYDKTLDLVVLTHPDKDHLAGLIEVARRYTIKRLWVTNVDNSTAEYEEWLTVLENESIQRIEVSQGDKMVFPDSLSLEIIWPKEESAYTSLNSTSIVMLLDFRDFEALLTGDADKQVQPYTSSISEVEFLKVPHHGAKDSLEKSFAVKLSPEVAAISAGENNSYGHPHSNPLETLSDIGSKIYRTDQNGTVEVVSDGYSWYTTTDR